MKLHERLQVPVAEIDAAMEQVVLTDPDLTDSPAVSDSILGLIRSGGKRLRPILVMIGGRFGRTDRDGYAGEAANAADAGGRPVDSDALGTAWADGSADNGGAEHVPAAQDRTYGHTGSGFAADPQLKARLIRTAVLMEYIHMASLVHDDIIDGAATRRGKPSLHTVTGVPTAVRIADYMIARAMEWYSSHDAGEDFSPAGKVAQLVAQLCIGEYRQLEHAYNFDQNFRQYLRKTRQKTAVLMAACLTAGAEAERADKETIRTLHRVGDAMGMAFQIQDDILDLTQDDRTLGKPAGSDLRSGNITLPVLCALQYPKLAADIRALSPASSDSEYRRVIENIVASPACEQAAAVRDRYIRLAERWIGRLSRYPAHQDLLILLHHLAKRTA